MSVALYPIFKKRNTAAELARKPLSLQQWQTEAFIIETGAGQLINTVSYRDIVTDFG